MQDRQDTCSNPRGQPTCMHPAEPTHEGPRRAQPANSWRASAARASLTPQPPRPTPEVRPERMGPSQQSQQAPVAWASPQLKPRPHSESLLVLKLPHLPLCVFCAEFGCPGLAPFGYSLVITLSRVPSLPALQPAAALASKKATCGCSQAA